jgi:transposase
MRFLPYDPEQEFLLPPSVHDVLGPQPLCFFVRRMVARLDLSAFEEDYEEEGRPAHHPAMRSSVWLYAYALGLTSARRLGQRLASLADCYLAGGAQPDYRTLNEFHQRHPMICPPR